MQQTQILLIAASPDQLSQLLIAANNVSVIKNLTEQLVDSLNHQKPQHVTIPQAAKMLLVSVRTIRNYLKEKRFTYTMSGNRKLLLVSELEAYLRENHYTINEK